MQKRTSKRWPFRKDADPREDPLHPETTAGQRPELIQGAESFEPFIENARFIAMLRAPRPIWPEWEAAREAGII